MKCDALAGVAVAILICGIVAVLAILIVAQVKQDRRAAAKKAGTEQKEEPTKPKNDNWWENQK